MERLFFYCETTSYCFTISNVPRKGISGDLQLGTHQLRGAHKLSQDSSEKTQTIKSGFKQVT